MPMILAFVQIRYFSSAIATCVLGCAYSQECKGRRKIRRRSL